MSGLELLKDREKKRNCAFVSRFLKNNERE